MTNALAALLTITNTMLCPVSVSNASDAEIWQNLHYRIEVTGNFTVIDDEHGVTFSAYSLEIPTNAVTVTTHTNVVLAGNGRPQTRSQTAYGCLVLGCTEDHSIIPAVPETERTETTVITERRVLRFKWLDVWREVVSEKELSRTVKKWVRKEQWEAVP